MPRGAGPRVDSTRNEPVNDHMCISTGDDLRGLNDTRTDVLAGADAASPRPQEARKATHGGVMASSTTRLAR